MWAHRFDDLGTTRIAFGDGATIDLLSAETPAQLAAIRVTVAAGARIAEHDHGGSDTMLLPLAGGLTLRGHSGEVHLGPGVMAFVAAGERVSVENAGEAPASTIVCFAPPMFVTALLDASAGEATAVRHAAAAAACP